VRSKKRVTRQCLRPRGETQTPQSVLCSKVLWLKGALNIGAGFERWSGVNLQRHRKGAGGAAFCTSEKRSRAAFCWKGANPRPPVLGREGEKKAERCADNCQKSEKATGWSPARKKIPPQRGTRHTPRRGKTVRLSRKIRRKIQVETLR